MVLWNGVFLTVLWVDWALGWFRGTYFWYHAHVWLQFELAAGLGEAWIKDGGLPQGCPLNMVFIIALSVLGIWLTSGEEVLLSSVLTT